MSYLVLARKYRPQSFEDLVGQEHVARTLANAIAQNRVAHAFLFTGVRGVGKTTSARLLAKCLNCLGPNGDAKGPTATPCQVCAACKEIAAGNDIDVQEIDGASYNGVDEVRRLQEGVAFRPARDRFKIYIVDEVHMLSNAAWNAFLKTLEEPPPHVKFIFATTEVHKVPVTILSRCQRYDFKLISTAIIGRRLKEVLALEKIVAEDEAVAVLAREAAGSMRDAMSLLDQVIAFSGSTLGGEDVARVLGVADRAILHELATALVGGDAAATLRVVERLAAQGFDLPHVARDVLRHLRNLVVAKVCGAAGAKDRELLDLADEEVKDVMDLAARADADDLLRLFQGFSRGFDEIVRSGQPRTALEMTLVRLARRPALLPLDELLARLGDLEKRLANGSPPPGGGGGGASAGGGSGARGNAGTRPRTTPGASAGPFESAPHVFQAPARSEGHGGGGGDFTRGALALSAPVESPRSAFTFTPPDPRPAPFAVPSAPLREAPRGAPPPPSASRSEAAPPPGSPAPAASSPPPVAPPPRAPRLERPENLAVWRALLQRVRTERAPLASMLEHAVALEVTAERVLLGYQANSFLGAQASESENLELLQRAARAHFGADTKVAIDLSIRDASRVPTVAAIDDEEARAALARARAAVEAHPLVQKAIALFGAELRDVRLASSREPNSAS